MLGVFWLMVYFFSLNVEEDLHVKELHVNTSVVLHRLRQG